MRTLMISLDNQVFDKDSRVAKRMAQYGKQTALDIVVPTERTDMIELSEEVKVCGTGGAKWQQFFTLVKKIKTLQVHTTYNLISTQDPFLLGLAAVIARKKNTALEVQLHGDFFSTKYYRTSGFKNWVYYWLARLVVLPRATRVRVAGERIKQSVIDLGIAEQNIVVRPVIFEVQKDAQPDMDLRQKYADKRIFLVLGRLHAVKNLAWLFERLVALPQKDWHLLVVGEGEEKSNLERAARKLGMEHEVTFLSWVKEPSGLLKSADCVLFPSLSEGYGLTPMEAVAMGCPVIMNDVGVAGFELQGFLATVIPISHPKEWEKALQNQQKRTL